MSDNDTILSKCTHPNATLSFLQTRYEGIPDTLVVNIVSWLVSIEAAMMITVAYVCQFELMRQDVCGGCPEAKKVIFLLQVLLGLFTILRKRAWNYGQIALVQKTDEKYVCVLKSVSVPPP